jgi:EAL domain-containing protein (putative c-di-GMP-specific phosphodiesterase class I)
MRATPVERLTLQRDVHSALRRDQFAVVYQPIVRADGGIAGVETLLRWRHPTLGMLLPDSFIPIVEESGAIQQVGEWVLERAVAQLVEWDRAGLALPRISVNVSARQFEHKTLRDQVERVLAKYGVAPERIELEVTESSVMRDANAAVKVLCELKDLGLRLAIDDFGIGYTSLSYLKRFPIDVIKIDRSFVRGLGSGLYDQAIVRAITMLAQIMGFTTVAEGVEHTEQAEYLRELDCDEMQGFLFSPPVPEDTCAELLRRSLPQVEAPA